ncbi:hypothetical protein PR202_gb08368 [Eleusine coracana subsp. coracana]|uniref:BTB domain-containing protein n=1 Tax=Eleusine coracana subsp. coracana TaxID=191504 RepID=A0AAV5EE36_ELECO|nr:hypothetical protein PR202_gb08368 [Eleusine coracana subsp. coracana]
MSTSAAVPAAPLDLQRHLGDLLVAGEGADVTFLVAGETFRAHRCVLAARSPVFKAELYGVLRQSAAAAAAELCIRIHDMEPQVFSALLQFVYTDSSPPVMATEGFELIRSYPALLKEFISKVTAP